MNSFPLIRRVSGLAHSKATLEQSFGLMDETLLFQTNSPRLLEAACEAFGRYPVQPGTQAKTLVVRLFVREPSGPTIPHAGDLHPQPIFHTQGHLLSVSVGAENMGVADAKQGFAYGYVTPAVAADLPYVRYTFVETLALCMLSRPCGYIPIHAACVVKGGRAILLQARAGTGKSTLSYACLRRGYHLLAEDVVHVKIGAWQANGTPTLRFWGTPWKLHLLPDASWLFPELNDQQAFLQMNGESKLELDLETHFPGQASVCAAPGPTILLERGQGGDTQLAYLAPQDACRSFEVLWHWDSGWTKKHEKAVFNLMANGAYTLRMNGSPDAAVDQIDQLLEEIL